jgi:type VI secretion system protein ImpH
VSYRDFLKAEPGRHDFFRVLRELERAAPHKPRIGDSNVVAEEVVALAQDPFLAFPDSNIGKVDETPDGRLRIHARFLGFFGPQGALPLSTTLEAYHWLEKDESFARFTDLFVNRFQQLFFRAWSDARPISQFDRPRQDRFFAFLGSFAGIGSDASRDRDTVADIAKLPFAGLVSSRIKSSRRLAQLIRGVFKLDATVVERVGSWLMFEPSDQMAMGQRGSSLGQDTFLGAMVYSINDKFRVAIRTTSLEQYTSLLPNSGLADKLADLIFFYVGHRYEYDVELSLPAHLAPPTELGKSGQLGWTSWVAPRKGSEAEGSYLSDARFNLSERRKAAKSAAKGTKHGAKAGTK